MGGFEEEQEVLLAMRKGDMVRWDEGRVAFSSGNARARDWSGAEELGKFNS